MQMDCRRNRLLQQALQYDIRAIDEDLYLAVLARRRAEDQGTAGDLS